MPSAPDDADAASECTGYESLITFWLRSCTETIEVRFHALGHTDGERLLHVTLTLRMDDSLIRVISARDMYRKERAIYERTET
ncbi:MAG: BrnT family toxin [Flavobacteriales bacterium]|nr:MAG: BrnT family toxin [Flavobacteriales bacterium]